MVVDEAAAAEVNDFDLTARVALDEDVFRLEVTMDEFESMDVLQRDVMYDTMFSVVMHRVLSAMGYCVVRFADMSRSGE